jgi:hypothetical protein
MAGTLSMHVRRQRDDDSQIKLLQIKIIAKKSCCVLSTACRPIYELSLVWRDLRLYGYKRLLLSKFVVSLVASWLMFALYTRRENLWFAVVNCPNTISLTPVGFNYSFLLYEIRNIIVWIAVSSCCRPVCFPIIFTSCCKLRSSLVEKVE